MSSRRRWRYRWGTIPAVVAAATLAAAGCGRTGLVAQVGAAAHDGGPDAGLSGPDGASDLASPAGREAGREVGQEAGGDVGSRTLRLVAGGLGGFGNRDGVGGTARFDYPEVVASDGAGNLYVADVRNFTIRQVATASGTVTTLAGTSRLSGSADGVGAAARFDHVSGLTTDGAGNLYVADSGNRTIRKVDTATGSVTTVAGSARTYGNVDDIGDAARFANLAGLTSDGAGNLYVVDAGNRLIRKIALATRSVTTLIAADWLYDSSGIATDGAGHLWVTDGKSTIFTVALATGVVSTLAGSPGEEGYADGTGAAARFSRPVGLATDGVGNLFVADTVNYLIRRVVIATGQVTTLAGAQGYAGAADGIGLAARFFLASGLAHDGAGDLYVADRENHTIRKVTIATAEVSTFAGAAPKPGQADGTGDQARFDAPGGIATDNAGNLFVADGSAFRKVALATGAVTTLPLPLGQSLPWAVASDGAGRLFVSTRDAPAIPPKTSIVQVTLATSALAPLASSEVGFARLASDGAGNLFLSRECVISRIAIATGDSEDIAGVRSQAPGAGGGYVDGVGSAARFGNPGGLASDGAGQLFVADTANHTIRQIVLASRDVTTLVGTPGACGSVDGIGPAARLCSPTDVALDGHGHLFVADCGNFTIRRIDLATSAVTTVVGVPGRSGVALGPLPGGLSCANGVAAAPSGELFISQRDENAVLVASF